MNKFLLAVLMILIPPVGVALKVGLTTQFWINLILTLIFWLPGAIHGLIVVLE